MACGKDKPLEQTFVVHDLEAGTSSTTSLKREESSPERTLVVEVCSQSDQSTSSEDSFKVITWDGPEDQTNPLNWSWKRKWTATVVVSCFAFISPFSSTKITPALDDIGAEYGIPEGFQQQLVMSIFLLGYAQGPFVLSPLSEIFGRVPVLQWANLMFFIFNTACPFARTKEQLLAFRFLSGVGGSAPQALCNGVLADCWSKDERGKGQAIYGILTFLGPVIAPIVGAYISEKMDWRWIFWSTSIFDIVVQITAMLLLRETYAPTILARKAKQIRKNTGIQSIRTEYDRPDSTLWTIMRKKMLLPLIMLFAHPACQAPSIYRAFLYGVMYLVLSTFLRVWVDIYDMTEGQASTNYLSLGIGFVIGLQLSHHLIDGLYAHFKRRYRITEGVPEWRCPPMLIGGLLAPVGLLIYGWSAQAHAHWLLPNLGCVLLAAGLIVTFQAAQAYVVDTYSSQHAASAAAGGAFLRTMCGFGFPLFAHRMYTTLGLGWGNSLLALVTLLLAVPSPVLLWFYGAKLRSWSKAGLSC